jgi:hypothetical protein
VIIIPKKMIPSNSIFHALLSRQIKITSPRKLAQIEAQMIALSSLVTQPDTSTAVALLQLQQHQQQNPTPPSYPVDSPHLPPVRSHDIQANSPVSLTSSHQEPSSFNILSQSYQHFQNHYQPPPAKRKRGDFEISSDAGLDAIGRGLISYEEAVVFFRCFFSGCVSPRS